MPPSDSKLAEWRLFRCRPTIKESINAYVDAVAEWLGAGPTAQYAVESQSISFLHLTIAAMFLTLRGIGHVPYAIRRQLAVGGNPRIAPLLEAFDAQGTLTRTDIRDLYQRNLPKRMIDEMLEMLDRLALATKEAGGTSQWEREVWTAVEPEAEDIPPEVLWYALPEIAREHGYDAFYADFVAGKPREEAMERAMQRIQSSTEENK